jgi:hypothetical protein
MRPRLPHALFGLVCLLLTAGIQAAEGCPSGSPAETQKIMAPDSSPGDRFGSQFKIDGDTMVVGAWLDDDAGPNAGAAYVYQRNASSRVWEFVKKLVGSSVAGGHAFGLEVDLSGDTIVASAIFGQAAYVFERNAGGVGNWGETKRLTGAMVGSPAGFGNSVRIDGDTLVVSTNVWSGDSGRVYVYGRNAGGAGNWGLVRSLAEPASFEFGRGIRLFGDVLAIDADQDSEQGPQAGAVFVYRRHLGGVDNWGKDAKLLGNAGDALSLRALGPDLLIAQAHGSSAFGPQAGNAHVFERIDGAWSLTGLFVANDTEPGDQFGANSAIVNDTLVIPAHMDDGGRGAVYFFGRQGTGPGTWVQSCRLEAFDRAAGDNFGAAVSASGTTLAVGAASADEGGTDAGAVYLYDDAFAAPVITVTAVVRPAINPRSNGVVAVSVLSTPDFDATRIAPETLRLGPAGAEMAKPRARLEDVNADGVLDLVAHFATEATGIECGAVDARLEGKTVDGQAIVAKLSIRTTGCGRDR